MYTRLILSALLLAPRAPGMLAQAAPPPSTVTVTAKPVTVTAGPVTVTIFLSGCAAAGSKDMPHQSSPHPGDQGHPRSSPSGPSHPLPAKSTTSKPTPSGTPKDGPKSATDSSTPVLPPIGLLTQPAPTNPSPSVPSHPLPDRPASSKPTPSSTPKDGPNSPKHSSTSVLPPIGLLTQPAPTNPSPSAPHPIPASPKGSSTPGPVPIGSPTKPTSTRPLVDKPSSSPGAPPLVPVPVPGTNPAKRPENPPEPPGKPSTPKLPGKPSTPKPSGKPSTTPKPKSPPKPSTEKTTSSSASTTSSANCEATGKASRESDLGDDPRKRGKVRDALDYCSKPKKGSKFKGARQLSGLIARAKPEAYLTVEMGSTKRTRLGGEGLWSGGFGTCVGVVITGTASGRDTQSAFLSHMSLSVDWDGVRAQWRNMRMAAEEERLTGMKAWIYTVDTSPDAPDVKGDPDMEELAEDLAGTYRELQESLQRFIGCGTVVRKTHPFSRVGEMRVSPLGLVEASD